jgi:D-glycero-alpha-D-manno-heptose-7-phosphate kinase
MTLAQERIEELNSHLMLFYTGIIRTASNVAESYVNDIENKRRQLRIMNDLLTESITVLNKGKDITGFGELLHEAWQAKRSLSAEVSNSDVDEIYNTARSAGAIGGKLTGAGGGGFMLLFVPPEKQIKVREKLSNLIYVPFKFEFSGSQIVYFNNHEDYSIIEKERAKQSIQAFKELVHSQKG